MGIRQKFLLSMVLGLGAFVALVLVSLYAQRQAVLDAYTARNRSVVSLAISMLHRIDERRVAGEISRDQAQAEGRNLLSRLRYDGNDYLFALDAQGILVAHPARPDLVGTSLLTFRDDAGNDLSALASIALQQGEGTIRYVFRRMHGGQPIEKISYVATFKPWGWMIGSGVYVADAQAAFLRGAKQMVFVMVPLAGLLLLVIFVLARSVSVPIRDLSDVVQSVTLRRFDQPVPHTDRADELGKLARAVEALQRVAEMEAELRRSRDLVASVFDASQEAAAVCDGDGRVLFASAALCRMSGYPSGILEGQSLDILRSGHQDDEFFDQVRRSLDETGFWEGDTWNRRANGEVFVVHKRISAIRDQNGAVVNKVVVMRDVVERSRHHKSQRYLPLHDPLTNLADAQLLDQRLTRALAITARTGRPTGLMVIDVDRFSRVNQELGMVAGDEALRFLALRLMKAVRSSDTVARLGRDDYAVLMEDLQGSDEAQLVVGRVLESMRAPLVIGGHTCAITVSVGMAMAPQDGHGEAQLLRAARGAVDIAKRAGGDRCAWVKDGLALVG